MDEKSFDYFCQVHSKSKSIMIRIYQDCTLKTLLKYYGYSSKNQDLHNIPLNMTVENFKNNKSIYIIDENQFFLGCVRNEQTGNIVLLGPVRMGEITHSDVSAILIKYGFPKLFEKSISTFLLSTPFFTLDGFLTLLSLFNLEINQKIVTIQEILKDNYYDLPKPKKEDYIETVDITMPHTTGDLESTFTYYIKNGMVDELDNIHLETHSGQIGQLGPNQLRSLKNSLIIMNSLCLRAAISGGLDTETAYSLGERYIKKIESSTSLSQLAELSPLIRKDYCQRVRELSSPKISNIYIHKVAEYVNNHIYEKITVSQLSKIVGITPEYLSLLAKQHLRCSLPQYVNKTKITEAKKLLRFTDKSLSEIAVLLGFSSQSHFQNQFKKIRGLTPSTYRKKYRVDANDTEYVNPIK